LIAALSVGLFAAAPDARTELAVETVRVTAEKLLDRLPDEIPFVAPGGDAVLTGRVSHIRDGDTLEIGGVPVRFTDLDCPELGTSAGETAKQHLVRAARGRALSCRLTGEMSYDRHLGACTRDDGTRIRDAMRSKGICS
jgi:endonuclease YncB( thermonuclease family)